MKIFELTADETRVYNALPIGHKYAIKRAELVGLIGINDRTVREILESLNEKRYTVCNLKDGKGYFIPKDEAEYEEYERIINTYKCSLGRKAYNIRKAREAQFGAKGRKYQRSAPSRRENTLQNAGGAS